MTKTIKQKVLDFLEDGEYHSSSEVANYLGVKRVTVNATLYKLMIDEKILERKSGIGKLGGYGYRYQIPEHIRTWNKKLKEINFQNS